MKRVKDSGKTLEIQSPTLDSLRARITGYKTLKITMGYVYTADQRLHEVVERLPAVVTM